MAKKSTPVIHFEIYVLVRGHWTLQVRYPHHQRDEALAEAKNLELSLGAAVKVIRETYFPDSNTCEEATAYLSPKATRAGSRPQRPRPRLVAPRPRPTAHRPHRPKTAEDAAPAVGTVVLKLLAIITAAMIVAALATAALPHVMAWLSRIGYRVDPDIYPKLVFATFAGTFLLVAMPATLTVLEGARRGFLRRFLGIGARGKRVAATGRGTPSRPAASEPQSPAPASTFQVAATKALSDVLAGVAERLLKGDGPQAARAERAAADGPELPRPPEMPAAREQGGPGIEQPDVPMAGAQGMDEGATPPEASDLERHRLLAMRFLGEAITTIKRTRPQLDAYNRFGINLLLAGAVDALGDAAGLGPEGRQRMLLELIGMLGSKGQVAQTFCERVDEYVLEPRYMHMIGLGRETMERFAAADATALDALPGAMERWNKPADNQAPQRITAVMFTDMVGSTDITQTQGDLAAQELVRRHNGIVRNALAEFGGREVKHTGDGIMASFASTASAVDAAVTIQRATATYNEASPSMRLQLRIGINAGEPIEEEDDLFGTTVQLAARLCAAADPEQIVCSNVVRELSAGTDRRFVSQGEQRLKGFREPIILHEVLWLPNGDTAKEIGDKEASGGDADSNLPQPLTTS